MRNKGLMALGAVFIVFAMTAGVILPGFHPAHLGVAFLSGVIGGGIFAPAWYHRQE